MGDPNEEYKDLSLPELINALSKVDPAEHSKQVAEIKQEIATRKAIVAVTAEAQQQRPAILPFEEKPFWFRRVVAFLIDLALFHILWNTITGFVTTPVAAPLLMILRTVLFAVYLVLFYVPATGKGSPGKRIMGLQLRRAQDDAATRPQIALRSTIIAVLVIPHWGDFFMAVMPAALPLIVASLAQATALALLIWSCVLAVIDPRGRAVHDRVAGTFVVRVLYFSESFAPTTTTAGPTVRATALRPAWLFLFCLLPTLVLVPMCDVINLGRAGVENAGQQMISARSMEMSLNEVITNRIAGRLNLRSKVEVWTGHITIADWDPQSTFEIKVNIPLVAWRDRATRVEIVDIASENLAMVMSQFDSVTVVVKTDYLLFKTEEVFPILVGKRSYQIYEAAMAAFANGDSEEGLELLEEHLAEQESAEPQDRAAVANTLTYLGGAYIQCARYQDALNIFNRARDLRRSVHGGDHAIVVESTYNIGYAYYEGGQYEQAIEYYREALKIADRTLEPGHAQFAVCIYQMALSYQRAGDPVQAEAHFRQALELAQNHPRKQSHPISMYQTGLAHLLREDGRPEEAAVLFEQALEQVEASAASESMLFVQYRAHLARCYFESQQYDKALPLLEKTLAIFAADPLFAEHPDHDQLQLYITECRAQLDR